MDEECKKTQLNKYSKRVLVGNWYEDKSMDLDKQRIFAEKTHIKGTNVGKCRTLFKNFEDPVELQEPNSYLPMGSIVQLRPHDLNLCDEKDEVFWNKAALSISCAGDDFKYHQEIGDWCDIMLSRSTKICARNSFKLVGSDDEDYPPTDFLCYGVPFRLQTVSSERNEPTFLYTCYDSHNGFNVVAPTTNAIMNGSRCLPVGLVREKQLGFGDDKHVAKASTYWTAVHLDPKQRFDMKGKEVPSFSPIIIQHHIMKRNLAIEKTIVHTLFGKEYLTSCHDHKDIYHRENWQNIWNICIQPKRVILFGGRAYT